RGAGRYGVERPVVVETTAGPAGGGRVFERPGLAAIERGVDTAVVGALEGNDEFLEVVRIGCDGEDVQLGDSGRGGHKVIPAVGALQDAARTCAKNDAVGIPGSEPDGVCGCCAGLADAELPTRAAVGGAEDAGAAGCDE